MVMIYPATSSDSLIKDFRTKAHFFLSRAAMLASQSEMHPREVAGLVAIRKLLESVDVGRLSGEESAALRTRWKRYKH
jgi:hypothetical protein